MIPEERIVFPESAVPKSAGADRPSTMTYLDGSGVIYTRSRAGRPSQGTDQRRIIQRTARRIARRPVIQRQNVHSACQCHRPILRLVAINVHLEPALKTLVNSRVHEIQIRATGSVT